MHSTPLGGRYKFISQLGAGGFSRTFLVQDLHLPDHPQCVIKQLMPKTTNLASLEMARRLFDTEARALYRLGDHSQIPTLLAHFEENREFYLAQEYIEGVQLSRQLAGYKRWPEAWVVILLREILEVLAFVHQKQVIHRDIKPSNLIRRRQDGRMVLIDFGAVKQVSARSMDHKPGGTNLTIAIGTQGYMPNEQLAGKPRFSSDVYSVGMIGVRALTGIHPKRLDEDIRTSEIAWRNHAPHVSPELAAVIDCMVRYDFRDRYQSAIEALEDLQLLPVDPNESLPFPEDLFHADKTGNHSAGSSLPSIKPPSQQNLSQEPVTNFQFNISSEKDETPFSASVSKTASTQFLHPSGLFQLLQNFGLTKVLSSAFWKQFLAPLPMLGALAALGVISLLVKTVSSSPSPQPIVERNQAATPPLFNPDSFANVSPLLSQVSFQLPKKIPDRLSLRDRISNLLSHADRLQADGQYQEALDTYNELIKLKPKQPEAYLGRCESLNALSQPEKAIIACNFALSFNPGYPEALESIGNAFEQLDRWEDALKIYQRATRIKPTLSEAWLGQAKAFEYFGRSEEAIKALHRATLSEQDSADAWAIKAEAQWKLGQIDEAITSLNKALQLEPTHPAATELRQQMQQELDADLDTYHPTPSE
ncbi:MAG: serine/threonine-protein kinase [Leptolyngbyaceae cyanobacterium MO_188.B28]|nr:serine/threonine-protein kinase [Leptolyngbyaceae cyanobacterium MO_188.B28]